MKGFYELKLIGKANYFKQSIKVDLIIEGNFGPPIFIKPLLTQSVVAGEYLEYYTPFIQDPDYDESFSIFVDLGSCSNFTKYE